MTSSSVRLATEVTISSRRSPPLLHREIFADIEWSSDRVLEQTSEQCARLGLNVHLLAEGDDVDEPADLERLGRFLASADHDCPRTENLFRRWGMLP